MDNKYGLQMVVSVGLPLFNEHQDALHQDAFHELRANAFEETKPALMLNGVCEDLAKRLELPSLSLWRRL